MHLLLRVMLHVVRIELHCTLILLVRRLTLKLLLSSHHAWPVLLLWVELALLLLLLHEGVLLLGNMVRLMLWSLAKLVLSCLHLSFINRLSQVDLTYVSLSFSSVSFVTRWYIFSTHPVLL
jgi:hypothetical protein